MHAKLNSMNVIIASSSTDMKGNPTKHMQSPSGIIGQDGEWIAKCKDQGMDSVTVELDI